MAMLRGIRSRIFRSLTTSNLSTSYLKSPLATAIPAFERSMSTTGVKESTYRTSMEELRSLRYVTGVKTPYLPNGRIDLDAYDNLTNMQIAKGVEGIVVAGTVSECYLMTWTEQMMLIAHTVNSFGDKVKIIGNAGSNCTSEAITATEQGFAVGMDAAMHINPYYGKTSSDGLIAHYNSVLSIGPVIRYNAPSRSAHDIPPSVVEKLAENPNLVGIKECSGNDRVKLYAGKGLRVWTANDEEGHEAVWECGATGLYSVTGNLIPGLMKKLVFEGKNPTLNAKLMPLFKWLFHVPIPVALNTALAQLGVIRPIFRLPHVPVPLEKRREFVNLVKEMGRENFVGEKDVQVLDDDDFIIVARY